MLQMREASRVNMLDSLTLIWEKVFLLAHLRVFSLLAPEPERKLTEEREEKKEREEEEVQKEKKREARRFLRGDLLEVPRTLFTHFGIYLGEDRVAHLIPDILPVVLPPDRPWIRQMVSNKRLLMGVLSKNASVRVDSVEDFAYGASIQLNTMDLPDDHTTTTTDVNLNTTTDLGLDRDPRTQLRWPPLENEEVARRAERLVGTVAYSLLWNNCEHFVTYCRYGRAESLQTDQFCDWIKSVIRDQRTVFLTAILGVLSILCLGLSPATGLLSLLLPFTFWMAS